MFEKINRILNSNNIWLKLRIVFCIFMFLVYLYISATPSLMILRNDNSSLEKEAMMMGVVNILSCSGKNKLTFFDLNATVGGDRILHVRYKIDATTFNDLDVAFDKYEKEGWSIDEKKDNHIKMHKNSYVLTFALVDNRGELKLTSINTIWGKTIMLLYNPIICFWSTLHEMIYQ